MASTARRLLCNVRMRLTHRTLAVYAAPLGLVALAACIRPPVESPRTEVSTVPSIVVDETVHDKVDILFMIDNSSSMDPMQLELRQRFGDFFAAFEALAQKGTYADLHIGVVTSDYGAGDIAGGGCDASPGGQRGLLQTLPSPNAINPPASCRPPADGARYVAYKFGPSSATTNLPNGSDAQALVDQFTCMASVGAKGCGFEHQLESVYQALHNTRENAGFLRNDAVLAVVFVTNEDDGSAAPNARFYEPTSDPAGTGPFGQYTTYRQTRFAVECGGAMLPYGVAAGPLGGCAPLPNPMWSVDAAFDVTRYTNFFSLPAALGGVKIHPEDVILVAIDGPEAPVETALVDPAGGNTPYHPCPAPMLSSTCVQALQHSCENTVQPGFFADPAVRLNAVVKSVQSNTVASICGDDPTRPPDFSSTMRMVADMIKRHIQPGCFKSPVINRADGTPDCVVEEVTEAPEGAPTIREIPSCAENGNVTPCWRLDDLLAQYQAQGCASQAQTCTLPDSCVPVTNPVDGKLQLDSVSIDRGGAAPPADARARISCTTIVSATK